MKRIEVKVKPNARESTITQGEDGVWLARIKSPPVDGKANRELIALIAKEFKVAKRQVVIRAGASSRLKHVQISD